ncbi:MAG: HAMP domain-containing sensor histidine kinase [Gammaproteobacteria bacterium]|nr:HAMP domain-containing sensor histidine kinase [Gammaproteobacteria bacterium]MDE0179371.1 HAMP domain-containing sensor histidine kinase [Gammaproteobacteria bacterium]
MSLKGTSIKWLSRSLIGRMTLLSVVFLVLALGWFTIVPYWSYVATGDPLDLTRSSALTEIFNEPTASLAESVVLKEIADANPEFRLYLRRGDEEFLLGDPPRHLALASSMRKLVSEPSRTSSSFRIQEEGAPTIVQFAHGEDRDFYYEIGGIMTPIASVQNIFEAVDPMLFWFRTRDPLIAGGGVLLIAFVVLLLAARSVRTLARAADTIDATSGDRHLLPEAGLPAEVATLVRAINEMIRRVEAAHEEQEMFLATAAHELRTPMTVLRTRLEELPDSETKAVLRDDVRRMASLVDQLLRLMQIRNSQDLPDEVNLVATTREVVAERAPLAIDCGVDIELDSVPESLIVKGHRGLVGVAIANLVDNAISFSKAGDTLKVSVDSTGTVSVSDCGPGIPANELERIFEPFAKSPPNRQGHGLGLAIVRAVMTAHGGEVSARNADGGGADFALRFANLSPQPA